jgi:hypothetical protein
VGGPAAGCRAQCTVEVSPSPAARHHRCLGGGGEREGVLLLYCAQCRSGVLHADEVNAVVLDIGTYQTKAGYAGEDAPKFVFPSVRGRSPRMAAALTCVFVWRRCMRACPRCCQLDRTSLLSPH